MRQQQQQCAKDPSKDEEGEDNVCLNCPTSRGTLKVVRVGPEGPEGPGKARKHVGPLRQARS